ncbi:ankyrin repeat-containing domain protein, partial [Lasiosphaeria ovina]
QTALSCACQRGHESIVQLLLETDGIDIDSKDKHDRTPLSYAAESGHEAVVKLLLESGEVDVD